MVLLLLLLLVEMCVDACVAVRWPPTVGMRRGGQLLHPAAAATSRGGSGHTGEMLVIDLVLFQLPVHPHHHY